jgi:hypothetical protein
MTAFQVQLSTLWAFLFSGDPPGREKCEESMLFTPTAVGISLGVLPVSAHRSDFDAGRCPPHRQLQKRLCFAIKRRGKAIDGSGPVRFC